MKTIKELCTEVSELTEINDHTGAMLEIAFYFNYSKFILIFKAIQRIHETEHYLPEEISAYRRAKYIELMNQIKDYQGEEIYNQIYKAF